MVITSEAEHVVWETGAWLQEQNWKRVGVDAKIMSALYRKWLTGFVSGANAQYGFRQVQDRLTGDTANRYEISQG
jgi:hypothetical protein